MPPDPVVSVATGLTAGSVVGAGVLGGVTLAVLSGSLAVVTAGVSGAAAVTGAGCVVAVVTGGGTSACVSR